MSNDEWLTPEWILEPIYQFYGEIDLDPFSHPDSLVKARNYYTKEQDGYKQPWSGSVFCNPPYSKPNLELVTKKAVTEKNRLEASIFLLIPAYTSTKWFQKYVFGEASSILFYNKRISFIGLKRGSPTFHSCLVFYNSSGNSILDFRSHFKQFGTIVSYANFL